MGLGISGTGFSRGGAAAWAAETGLNNVANPRTAFLGQVSNNCLCPGARDATRTTQMGWTGHTMLAPYTGTLKIGYANWYAVSNAAEANGGAVATMKLAVMYPYGTITQATVSVVGGATATIIDGANVEFEASVQIPVGAKFWLAPWRSCSAGVLYSQVSDTYTLNPDRSFIYAAGGANDPAVDLTAQTYLGYSSAENQRFQFLPIYIAGMTSSKSVISFGDSRDVGATDSMDSRDYTNGQFGRALAAQGVPHIKASVSGESLFSFITTSGSRSAKRRALSAYATHQVLELGINDLNATPATPIGFTVSALALLDTTKPRIVTTMPPYNTSSDSFVTTVNQTVNALEACRTAMNDHRRSIAGIPCWEMADAIETNSSGVKTRNGGRWGCITSTGALGASGTAITSDGIHENFVCNRFYRDTGAVRGTALA